MKLYSKNKIYRYVPNYLDNRRLAPGEQIVVNLRCVHIPEYDDYQRETLLNTRKFSPDKAQELNEKRFQALVSSKFVSVEGLEIEGLAVKGEDFEQFYAEAPPELVNEILQVVLSSERLTAGEQKNFVPESDLPLSAPAAV